MKYDIFISYSSKDRVFVDVLVRDLQKAGLLVWVDVQSLTPGDSIAAGIEEALTNSLFMLIVMSPDYFASAWTTREWQFALGKESETKSVRLVPLFYKDCDIPPLLRSKLWVDFRNKDTYRETLERLVDGIHLLKAEQRSPNHLSEQPQLGERVEQLTRQEVLELKKFLQEATTAFRARPTTQDSSTSHTVLPEEIAEDVCFIVMPFGIESLGVVYEDFVKPVLIDTCQLRPLRGDDVFGSNVVMDDITKSIRKARLIIADLTGRNANVFYEVGIAHALNKPVLLMTQSIDDVPFDLRHRRSLIYEYSPRGCKKLEGDLQKNVKAMLADVPS